MKSARGLIVVLLSLLLLVFVWRLTVPLETPLPVTGRKIIEAAPMCPWRQPKSDMAAFFPKATSYKLETVILTSHFREFKTRLGRLPTSDENPLYLHRVFAGSNEIGSILVRRVKGEYGAIEIVLGIAKNGSVAGVRIQRMREPQATANALDAAWLRSFRGKNSADSWKLSDVSPVPDFAKFSAQAIVEGVRSLLILHDVGAR